MPDLPRARYDFPAPTHSVSLWETGQNVRRHDLGRSNASMIKPKKNSVSTHICPEYPHW